MRSEEFEWLNAIVIGVSRDSIKSHKGFMAKNGLKLVLLSDPVHELMEKYGVWQLKKLYGKESWGAVRSTFLIDPQGKLAYAWRNVKVPGHAEAVKQKLAELER